MKIRMVLLESAAIAVVIFLSLTADVVRCQEESAGEVFEMREVSVFDIDSPIASMLQSGMSARECGDNPNKNVTAYPEFKSEKPLYGTAMFDMSIINYGCGINYYFALDESGGTGTGYDRFYFDANHDMDLTNDGILSLMANPPAELRIQNQSRLKEIAFDYLQFQIDYGSGEKSQPVKIIPKFRQISENKSVRFIYPTARKGKVRLGSKEFEAVLSQGSMISGSYDRQITYLFLGNNMESMPILSAWRFVDGKFYTFCATASGDKLTVKPYSGPYGLLEVGSAGENIKDGTIELGWLQSRDAIIDIAKCDKEDGKLKVPVGDYRPFKVAVRYDGIRMVLNIKIAAPEEPPTEPPVFGMQIRPDKPFVFNLTEKPEVIFNKPAANQRIMAGTELKVEAILFYPEINTLIGALEDTTKKKGDNIKLPDGTEYANFESIDPTVEIINSSVQVVAEGKMPFG